ncbi:MAG TPA: hypothetical protein VN873_14505 [Candidatus Angelobacter sp.]|nr:hypothetical protein [Candidatus Angelobacter sp.]
MEPERRIEKWLRAFAKKRREQAGEPMKLRPDARQQLHGEISRPAPGQGAGGFFANFLAALRPRFALVLMAVAIVAVAAFLLVPGRHEGKAMKVSSLGSRDKMAAPSTRTASPIAAPTIAPPVATPSPAVTAAKDYDENNPGVAAQQDALKPAGAGAIAASTPPFAAQAFHRMDVPKGLPAVRDAARRASTRVLTSFRVEQQGDQMRVVDSDGSVYTGAVQWAREDQAQNANAANANLSPRNKAFANQVARNVQQIQAAQSYFFRVAGTNRNLKQPVVFSGNLIPLTNAPVSQIDSFGGGGGAGQNIPQQGPVQALLSNSRIAGTAVIGDKKEIEVNATPAR